MITIHHLSSSQSERIVWLFEELGLPYELKRYERDPVTRRAPAEYTALHPLGTAPVIVDGELLLPESGAIIEYVIHTYGNGRLSIPPNAPNYANYLFWWHFANGSMMPATVTNLLINHLGGAIDPLTQMLSAKLDKAYGIVEARLGEAAYFAGEELTAADILMLFPLTNMRRFAAREITAYPNLKAYLKNISDRPAYRAALAKAEPGITPVLI